MKHIFYLICIILLFSACDKMSNEPKVSSPLVSFEKKGGEQLVRVQKLNGSEYDLRKAPWFYNPSEFKDIPILKTETLRTGEIRYYNDWVSFTVTTSFKEIKIVVKKNDTGQSRSYTFYGQGEKIGFIIKVLQKG